MGWARAVSRCRHGRARAATAPGSHSAERRSEGVVLGRRLHIFICIFMDTITTPPILDHLAALGDETRSRILALLERSEFNVSELCDALQLPQSTVSRQLRALVHDGWLEARAEGRMRHYRISEGMGESHRRLWKVVRDELSGTETFRVDAERGREVLAERRRRSAEFFAASADDWHHLRRDLFGARAEFLPFLGFLDPRWTVGDLGSGTGILAETMAPFVQRVVAVDRSAEMLEAASVRLDGLGNVELRPGELESLPVEDAELDLAILSLVLHYVVDPGAVLSEVFRTLRPGGRVVIVEMRTHDRGAHYAAEMGHVWPGFTGEQMGRWLAEAGFGAFRTALLPPDPGARGPLLFISSAERPQIVSEEPTLANE